MYTCWVHVHMLLSPPHPALLFWTYQDSSHPQHYSETILNVVYDFLLPWLLVPWKLLFSIPPEIARSVTLSPQAKEGQSDFSYCWRLTLSPCGPASGTSWGTGLQPSSPLPHPALGVQAWPPPCGLSSTLCPLLHEPRRFLSPGLLYGQRTALPAKPPGRPITKLYSPVFSVTLILKDTPSIGLWQPSVQLSYIKLYQWCTCTYLHGAECFPIFLDEYIDQHVHIRPNTFNIIYNWFIKLWKNSQ